MMTALLLNHLRFRATAVTDVILGEHYAGNNLRNALANMMLHATCPEKQRGEKPTPEHAAVCQVCWLLAAEEDPGSVVRAYAVVPPQPPRQVVRAGDSFAFGLTLFGDGWRFFPYIVLAANEVGYSGVGPGRHEGKGRFHLDEIGAFNPLSSQNNQLLKRGETLVKIAPVPVSFEDALMSSAPLQDQVQQSKGELTIYFHSPTRLEKMNEQGKKRPIRVPDFSVFFQRLLYRIDDLGRHFAHGEKRPKDEVLYLQGLADRVRLVNNDTEWVDLWSWSGRKRDRTPIGGLVGSATYQADEWGPLLPWLVFGQGTQVGKSTPKGLGVYSIGGLQPSYWSWLRD